MSRTEAPFSQRPCAQQKERSQVRPRCRVRAAPPVAGARQCDLGCSSAAGMRLPGGDRGGRPVPPPHPRRAKGRQRPGLHQTGAGARAGRQSTVRMEHPPWLCICRSNGKWQCMAGLDRTAVLRLQAGLACLPPRRRPRCSWPPWQPRSAAAPRCRARRAGCARRLPAGSPHRRAWRLQGRGGGGGLCGERQRRGWRSQTETSLLCTAREVGAWAAPQRH